MNRRVVRSLLLLGLCLVFPVARAQAQVTNMADVKTWRIWEGVFRTTQAYVNPSYDVQLKVTFTPPAGSGLSPIVAYGFWDGKEGASTHVFKVRTALPPAPGLSPWIWTWTQSCTGGGCNTDPVLNPSSPTPFSVSVTPSTGGHALFNPGFLKVHSSGRYLIHDNGTPFYWLGDTAWNAPVRAANAPSGGAPLEWENYVNARKAKGFTVIQIALPVDYMDNKKDGVQPQDVNGQTPFTQLTGTGRTCATELPNQCSQWNPAFWGNFEQKVRYANAQGLAVLVVGMAERIHEKNTNGTDPAYPNNSDLLVYARNVVARLGGHFVMYSPGFDRFPGGAGCTTAPGDMTCRIDAVGTHIESISPRHLVTNHFAGSMDVTLMAPFINETWYDFQLYQSGQGCNATSEANQLNLVTNRPRTMALYLYDLTTSGGAHKPVVNGEAIYDGARCASGWTTHFTPYRSRQAGYLSMTSGAAGYTLGVIGVYDWGLNGTSWSTGEARPSGGQMQILCRAFRGLPAWQQLVPDHNLIANKVDPSTGLPWTDPLTMTVARDANNQFAVAYLPNNPAIKIDATNFANFDNWTKQWIDPRTGTTYTATCLRQGISLTYRCDPPTGVTIAPGESPDWVLRVSALPFLSTTATCG